MSHTNVDVASMLLETLVLVLTAHREVLGSALGRRGRAGADNPSTWAKSDNLGCLLAFILVASDRFANPDNELWETWVAERASALKGRLRTWTDRAVLLMLAVAPMLLLVGAPIVWLGWTRGQPAMLGLAGALIAGALSLLGVAVTRVNSLEKLRSDQLERRDAHRREEAEAWHSLIMWSGLVSDAKAESLGIASSRAYDASYLPRTLDGRVSADRRLQELLRTKRFVLIVGESAAGKSRTALEAALAAFPRSTLIVPNTDELRPETLRRLVGLTTRHASPSEPTLLWLDDLDRYLAAEALTTAALSAATDHNVTALGTMQTRHWRRWRFPPSSSVGVTAQDQGIDGIAEKAAAVLRLAAVVELPRTLQSELEQQEASRRFGTHDWMELGLGEVLSAGPDLVEKLDQAPSDHPHGVAIVQAATDWRRIGLSRPIARGELQGLSDLYLPSWSTVSEDFEAGVRWACESLPRSEIRLLSLRYRAQVEYFEPHDYVVADRERRGVTVPDQIWNWVIDLDSVSAQEALQVGNTANSKSAQGTAVRAFAKAATSANAETAARALFNKGTVLAQIDRLDEAIEAFDELYDRFGDASDPTLRQHAANALFNKGVVLGQMDRTGAETVAFDELVRRFGDAPELALRQQVAHALFNKAIRLGELNHPEEEVATYDQLIGHFSEASEVSLREEVANALFMKGIKLGQLDRPEEEVAAYDELIQRFGDARDLAFRQQVANALFNKGIALKRLDRLEEEIATYDELVLRFGELSEPASQRLVANALFNKGIRLGQLHRRHEEIATYDELIRRHGESAEAAVRRWVWRARSARGRAIQG